MRKRVTRISPFQLGKVSAVLYGLFALPIALILGIAAVFGPPEQAKPWALIVAIPVFYMVFGFLFMPIAAWMYNLVAKWTGGVEYVTAEVPDA
jgi:uncharacterized oligopeptide transporter (OPT) family protein